MEKSKKMIIFTICVFFTLMTLLFILMNNIVKQANDLLIKTPDLTDISDGEYIGEYSVAPVRVKVSVTIADHEITGITILEHDNGLGSAAESIVNDIVATQSLETDAISGATVSSRCILKEAENAIGE